MPENQDIDELEELFAKFDKKVSEFENKFSTLEKQLQEFRQAEIQQDSGEPPASDAVS